MAGLEAKSREFGRFSGPLLWPVLYNKSQIVGESHMQPGPRQIVSGHLAAFLRRGRASGW